MHVLVTGASGRTGQLVLDLLLQDARFAPKALVRSEASAARLLRSRTSKKVPLEDIVICDVTTLPVELPPLPLPNHHQQATTNDDKSSAPTTSRRHALQQSRKQKSSVDDTLPSHTHKIPAGISACDAMVICTSAVPKISKRSLARALLQVPLNWVRGKQPLVDFTQLHFSWKHGQTPELVD
jgi:hypothetical protein